MMARYVLNDLTEVFCYLPWALAGGIICLLLLGLRKRGRCGVKKAPALAFALFVMYLIILSGLVFFGRPPGSRHGLALGLFDTVGDLRSNAYVLENVLLFLPFGLFYGCFAHRHACSAAVRDREQKGKAQASGMSREQKGNVQTSGKKRERGGRQFFFVFCRLLRRVELPVQHFD